jgi:hypothetical protein
MAQLIMSTASWIGLLGRIIVRILTMMRMRLRVMRRLRMTLWAIG